VVSLPAFVWIGPWAMISNTLPGSPAGFRQPYHAGKYQAQLAWFMQDAGLEGNAYSEYAISNFLGFWLTPGTRLFINGSLNVPPDVVEANRALRRRTGTSADESFERLLDRYAVDFFLGMRLPVVPPPGRPWFYTTAHVERSAGWIPIFRSLTSSIYMRVDERNASNLERIAAYYEEQGIPFDRERGFDAEAAIRSAPGWCFRFGLVPLDFAVLIAQSQGFEAASRAAAQTRLASVYAALGLYEQAMRVDRRLLRASPERLGAHRRIVWSLLRLGRADDARREAERLSASHEIDPLSQAIVDAANRYAASTSPGEADAITALLPVFTPAQATILMRAVASPTARPEPPRR
jgi:tetratricopeptide (TPR) repeat protein